MSLLEQQNFLARIYTDDNLRSAFLANPLEIGKQYNLNETEISEIVEIFPNEISAFAESLVWKRLREVEKILPLSREILSEDFVESFREFAPTFNSTAVKKHLEDALRFGAFLQNQKTISAVAKNAAKYECAKLEFYALQRNLVVRFFDFDVQDNSPRKHLKIWLRIGKREMIF